MCNTMIKSDLNDVTERQQMVNLLRATTQYRLGPFGKLRKFQAIDLRLQGKAWQVLDSDGKWYTEFWCES